MAKKRSKSRKKKKRQKKKSPPIKSQEKKTSPILLIMGIIMGVSIVAAPLVGLSNRGGGQPTIATSTPLPPATLAPAQAPVEGPIFVPTAIETATEEVDADGEAADAEDLPEP